jgi:hypothetical protein
MFSSTVRAPIRLNAWKMNPIRARRSSVSLVSDSRDSSVSPIQTRPEVGRSRPAAVCSRVLLPEPDGPITAVKVPRPNVASTPASATTGCRSVP